MNGTMFVDRVHSFVVVDVVFDKTSDRYFVEYAVCTRYFFGNAYAIAPGRKDAIVEFEMMDLIGVPFIELVTVVPSIVNKLTDALRKITRRIVTLEKTRLSISLSASMLQVDMLEF
jgi:hypothetical protein